MNNIMQGEPLVIFGDGEQTRAFTHIADVAPHIARVVDIPETSGEVFNVGSDKHVSVNELADLVMDSDGKGSLCYQRACKRRGEARVLHTREIPRCLRRNITSRPSRRVRENGSLGRSPLVPALPLRLLISKFARIYPKVGNEIQLSVIS